MAIVISDFCLRVCYEKLWEVVGSCEVKIRRMISRMIEQDYHNVGILDNLIPSPTSLNGNFYKDISRA